MHALLVPVRFLIAICLATALTSPAAAQRSARPVGDFGLKLQQGQEVWFSMKQVVDMSMASPQIADSSRQQKMEQDLLLRLSVLAKAGEETHAELTIEKVVMVAPFDGGTKFDSTTPESEDVGNAVAMAMRPIVGKKLQLRVLDSGSITSITGLEDLLAAGPVGTLLGNSFNEEAMKRRMTPVLSPGTTRRVRVGDSWRNTDTIKFQRVGEVRVSMKHTLKNIKDGVASVAIKGEVSIDAGLDQSVGAVSIRSEALSGQYEWDTEAGLLNEMSLDRRIEFEASRGSVTMFVIEDVKTTVKRVDAPESGSTTTAAQ